MFFSVTLLLACFQLTASAVAAQPNAKRHGGLNCRKAPQWSTWSAVTTPTTTVKSTTTLVTTTTTTPSSTITTTTTSASTTTAYPTACPTTFQLFIIGGSFGDVYFRVNATNQYDLIRSPGTTFTLQGNRLVPVAPQAGVASIPKGTTQAGAFVISTLDTVNYEPIDVSVRDPGGNTACRLVVSKRVSSGATLDELFSYQAGVYFAPSSGRPADSIPLPDIVLRGV